MSLDYAPIVLQPSKGFEFYKNPHTRKRQLAAVGVDVFESVNPIDDEEEDDDSTNGIELDAYMTMHCKKGVLSSPVRVVGCPSGDRLEPPLKRTCSHNSMVSAASGGSQSRSARGGRGGQGGPGGRASKNGGSSAHSSSNRSADVVLSRGPSIFGKSRKRCLNA